MPQQEHVTMRLPADLLNRVEDYRKHLEQVTRQQVTRASALRALIDAGLEKVGQ